MSRREIYELTDKIIARAEEMGIAKDKRLNHFMDIEFASTQFNMDMKAWLNSDDENFMHDFIGIYNNVDRSEKNFGFFVPRFAQ